MTYVVKVSLIDEHVGKTQSLPQVGKRFAIVKDDGSIYQTSPVKEVDEVKGTFRTIEGTYEYEVVKS